MLIFGHLHLTLILDQPHDPIFLWLVVYLPSEKYEFVSWDYDIPNIWKVIKAMFQTTNQFLMTGQSPARCAPWSFRASYRSPWGGPPTSDWWGSSGASRSSRPGMGHLQKPWKYWRTMRKYRIHRCITCFLGLTIYCMMIMEPWFWQMKWKSRGMQSHYGWEQSHGRRGSFRPQKEDSQLDKCAEMCSTESFHVGIPATAKECTSVCLKTRYLKSSGSSPL